MTPIQPCRSLDEVREQIDRIDRAMLGLLAERGAYVRQAAGFKRDAAEVAAPQRVAQILERLRQRAGELGADPDVAEATWRAMIAAFIAREHHEFARLRIPSSAAGPASAGP